MLSNETKDNLGKVYVTDCFLWPGKEVRMIWFQNILCFMGPLMMYKAYMPIYR